MQPKNVHLIGIAGTAMASLARLLTALGHRVRGSDQDVYPPMSTQLDEMKLDWTSGYDARNLDPAPDLVVVGNAIPRGNPELEACLDRGLAYTSQAEALEDMVLPGRHPVVVTGTHGKTTTTSLIAWLLRSAGRDPGWFIGGVPRDFDASAGLGGGREFVIEGDEYDTAYFDKRPKFHHYRPRLLVIGNLEFDHADIYPDLDAIRTEFRRLVNTVPRSGVIVVGAESEAAVEVTGAAPCPVVPFALDPAALPPGGAGLSAAELRVDGDGTRFVVDADGAPLGEVRLPTHGEHNVRNALAALAVARQLDVPFARAAAALAAFGGVRRRLERVGVAAGVEVYDDFAHHPTAITETVAAVRRRGVSGRLWAVLEPRSWSMRRNVHQKTLGPALGAADVVVMTDVFQPERIAAELRLDTGRVLADVAAAGARAHAAADPDEVVRLVAAAARPGDVVVVMSNGGFGGVPRRLVDALTSGRGGDG